MADSKEVSEERRKLMSAVAIGAGCVGAALIGAPVAGFLLAPLFEGVARVWRSVGAVAQFKEGETVEVSYADASPEPWAGVTGKTAAWVRSEPNGGFTAFAVNCTHLGCPVRWLPQAELFMCPCHGGVYYKDGTVAAGPPPRPLTQYPVRVRDGQLEILAVPTPIT